MPTTWTRRPDGFQAVTAGSEVEFPEVAPGMNRLIFFVDADGDSSFSLLPAAEGSVDSQGQEVEWYFEPYAMVDSLRQMLLDREFRFRLGRTGAKMMQRDWDLDEQIRRHLAIYQRLAANYPVGSKRMQQMYIPSDFRQLGERLISAIHPS